MKDAAVPGWSHHTDHRPLQLRNCVSSRWLPVEELCSADVDIGLCGWAVWLIECIPLSDYYNGSFLEIVPRKTAKNTVKHRGGSVGSSVANHCSGGGNSLIITTLNISLPELL